MTPEKARFRDSIGSFLQVEVPAAATKGPTASAGVEKEAEATNRKDDVEAAEATEDWEEEEWNDEWNEEGWKEWNEEGWVDGGDDWVDGYEVEGKEAGEEEVTPVQQSEMRGKQRKTLKRGRKPGQGKKGQRGETKSQKRAILKRKNTLKRKKVAKEGDAKPSSSSKSKKEKPARSTSKSEARASKKRSAEVEPGQKGVPKKVHQGRVELGGKKWRYEVLEGQIFGCSNCRWIYNGCRSCQKPSFRGRSAADIRLAEMAEKEGNNSSEKGKNAKGVRKATTKASRSNT